VALTEQDSPPKPKDSDVFIETTKAFRAYVASYGGFETEKSIIEHASQLIDKLKEEGEDVQTKEYFAAGYDPPFALVNRHNEVWVLKADDGVEKLDTDSKVVLYDMKSREVEQVIVHHEEIVQALSDH
jgi:hypothetical protein